MTEGLLSFSPESRILSLLSKNIKIKIYRITVLFVVLYGSEIWSVTLRTKHMLIVMLGRMIPSIKQLEVF